jgi:Zn-dependent M28 family amino/carboxypeptidase
MHRFLALSGMSAAALLALSGGAEFNGQRALDYTAHMVSFGERPSGSAANTRTAEYIERRIRMLPCRLSEDRFNAQTPAGAVPMRNIIADCGGDPGARLLVISGHYDTKRLPGFVGANDGGSSAGLLLELAQAVAARKWKHQVRLVWFDGEEAVRPEWTTTDSVYGSSHLAHRWQQDGTLPRIDALINVDMIGDKDLDIVQEQGSSQALNKLVWRVAADLRHQDAFQDASGAIDDDHMPFRRLGVNAIDLIDFDFGPRNSYWHTPQDTMDKLSAHSLQVVGSVVLETLERLD